MTDNTEKKKKVSYKERKAAEKHNKELNRLLQRFFRFLDKKPKPSDQEIRIEFVKSEMAWKYYCFQHSLGFRTSMLFNARVACEWERKYMRRQEKSN